LEPKTKEASNVLMESKKDSDLLVRQTVWKTVLTFTFDLPMEHMEQVETEIAKLVSDGYLLPDIKGYLNVYGRTYVIASEAELKDDEINTIKNALMKLLTRIENSMRSRAIKNPVSALLNKPGMYLIYAPPEPDGIKWYPGGHLLLENRNGIISPISASGKLQQLFWDLHIKKISLTAEQLGQIRPPVFKENQRDYLSLWFIIKRALTHANWLESAKKAANVSEIEFFLKEKPGTCLVDMGEKWEEGDIHITRPIFLVQRLMQEGKKYIAVCSTPLYLTSYLKECYTPVFEEEKFTGCKQPLQALLQARYGMVLRKSRDEDKKEIQINN
jgi:hypothetical protein